jgi:hypothetical protein
MSISYLLAAMGNPNWLDIRCDSLNANTAVIGDLTTSAYYYTPQPADPPAPTGGRSAIYYNSVSNVFRYYNLNLLAWTDLDTTGAGVTLAAIGAAPNANGATLTGTVLNLEPASATFGGVVTTGLQTFAGAKTFANIESPIMTKGGFSVLTTNDTINATQIQGVAVSAAAPATNQYLRYDGAQWAPSLITGNATAVAYFDGSGNLISSTARALISNFGGVFSSNAATLGGVSDNTIVGGVANIISGGQYQSHFGGSGNSISGTGFFNCTLGGGGNAITTSGQGNVIISGTGSNIGGATGTTAIIAGQNCLTTGGSYNLICGDACAAIPGALYCFIAGSQSRSSAVSNFTFSDAQAVVNTNSQASSAKFRLLNGMNVTDGTVNANNDASALFQLDTNTKGLLKPRMTTAQKNAIAAPALGLEVYDTTLNAPQYYNGSAWVNSTSQIFNKYIGAQDFDPSFCSATAGINGSFQIEMTFANSGSPNVLWSMQTPPTLAANAVFTVTLYWYAANVGNVVWVLGSRAQNVGGAIATTPLSETIATGVGAVANTINSTAIVANGAAIGTLANQVLSMRIYRDAGNVNDTLTSQAFLLGVLISWP